jgi:hypothetical protein
MLLASSFPVNFDIGRIVQLLPASRVQQVETIPRNQSANAVAGEWSQLNDIGEGDIGEKRNTGRSL